ncbi:MAG: hypothetical protein LAO79_16300, partial [Acidobacteriia bacterium]|nr:hypothetical protein [Terriglobia bacterium]
RRLPYSEPPVPAEAPVVAAVQVGGGTGGGGITATNAAEVRTNSARVPPGTTFQAQYLLTQPRPIASGGSRISIDAFDVNGVAIFSPLGDAAGAAVWQNGFLSVNVISPSGDYGSNLDYPYMTVTMTVPATTPIGSTFPLGLVSASYIGPTGPLTLTDPKPGTLTIGGSVSIHNVTPGGGTWPAGTVVKFEGTGFSPLTKLTAKMRMSPITYVSSTELHFTLLDVTTMDMVGLTAQNPDESQVTYFSYLRGGLLTPPSRPLLRHTDPVFQAQTHGVAQFSVPALAAGQFAAIAIQNPTPGPVVVTFQVQSTGATTTFTLPFGGRIVDEISSLVGSALNAGDSVTVTSTSGVQILGLLGDETQGTVEPFLPVF